jgi:hypothetical protein
MEVDLSQATTRTTPMTKLAHHVPHISEKGDFSQCSRMFSGGGIFMPE